MNKYLYARIYLRALLILAVLVALAGLTFASVQVVWILSDIDAYQVAKSAPLSVDIEGLDNELKLASVVANSFVSQNTQNAPSGEYNFAIELKKRNIKISEATQLRPAQIEGFESCLRIARDDSAKFKTDLLNEFTATLNDIETSVRSVLKVEPVLKVQSSETRHQLFSPEALAVMQFHELDAAVSFLKNGPQGDIRSYISPQVGMRTAADELRALLQLIRVDQLTDVEQATPSTKGEVLERFLSELTLCEQLAKVNISRDWVIDTRMENLENNVTSFRAEQKARLTNLRSEMFHCATLTVVALLLTAIVALMLLIIRDFFSALIDTAVNTGATANTLDKMSQGSTGDTGER